MKTLKIENIAHVYSVLVAITECAIAVADVCVCERVRACN